MQIFKNLNRKKTNPLEYEFIGEQFVEETAIQLFIYDKESYSEDKSFTKLNSNIFENKKKKYWLNFHGIYDSETIISFCSDIGIHRLAIQDILDTNQRPKFQVYENYYFFSVKSILPSKSNLMEINQLSIIMGENYIVTFQEKNDHLFEHIRERIRNDIGIVRERTQDFLLYLFLESILDNYLKTIGTFDNSLEKNHKLILSENPSPSIVDAIEDLKSKVHIISNDLFPIKEFITKLERENFLFVKKEHYKYYYELKDLCSQIADYKDSMNRELESNINLFFSRQGHRMNEVMKTLTIVATIFIPLTFLAGVYGMNFKNMPELEWEFGYFATIIFMVIISIGMIFYFKKKKLF